MWLVDCPNSVDVIELATQLYRESLTVPYTGRFVLYGRRHHPEEALLRCLCLTDDSAEKTLEQQEGFQLVATGPAVEVSVDHRYGCCCSCSCRAHQSCVCGTICSVDYCAATCMSRMSLVSFTHACMLWFQIQNGHVHWIETAGNLVPVDKSEEQLQLGINAFRENRLSMLVRLRDNSQPAAGKVAFMRYPRSALQTLK